MFQYFLFYLNFFIVSFKFSTCFLHKNLFSFLWSLIEQTKANQPPVLADLYYHHRCLAGMEGIVPAEVTVFHARSQLQNVLLTWGVFVL